MLTLKLAFVIIRMLSYIRFHLLPPIGQFVGTRAETDVEETCTIIYVKRGWTQLDIDTWRSILGEITPLERHMTTFLLPYISENADYRVPLPYVTVLLLCVDCCRESSGLLPLV